MKPALSIILLLLLNQTLKAQSISFDLANPQPDLIDIYSGSSASGDIDGDGDIDLIMTGIDPGKRTALYLNDGTGNFTEVEDTPFPNASAGLVYLEDLDGDGDLDLLFSGNGFEIQEFTHYYLNDGAGVFTYIPNNGLPPHADTGMALADLDGDEDLDLILAVRDALGELVADTYLNFGNAQFGPSESTAFTKVEFARLETLDVENDGDSDIIISGVEEDGSSSVRLYLNDGDGNFTEDTSAEFENMQADDIDALDSDGDGDMDILMSGMTGEGQIKTLLYVNNGLGAFTLLENTGIQDTFAGTNAVADLDLDGDDDLLVIGSQAGGLPNIYNIVYQNQGNNSFLPVDTVGGEYIARCSVDDFNGDDLPDLVIQGFVDNTNVYWNTTQPLSVQEAEIGNLKIYPNPSSGVLSLDIDGYSAILSFSIYSLNGQLLYQERIDSAIRTDIALNLPSGAYLAVVQTAEGLLGRELLVIE
jgi:hypothetical protein